MKRSRHNKALNSPKEGDRDPGKKLLWNIPVHCVKMYYCDWFKKKLKGQQVGRIWGQRELWEDGGRCHEMQNKQDGQNMHEVNKPGAAHSLVEMG